MNRHIDVDPTLTRRGPDDRDGTQVNHGSRGLPPVTRWRRLW